MCFSHCTLLFHIISHILDRNKKILKLIKSLLGKNVTGNRIKKLFTITEYSDSKDIAAILNLYFNEIPSTLNSSLPVNHHEPLQYVK